MVGAIVAVVLGCAGVPTLAEAPASDAALVVHMTRMVSPDGAFAATFPCKASDVVNMPFGGGVELGCMAHGMMFGISRGVRPILPEARLMVAPYAQQLNAARNANGPDNVSEVTVSGHPAFRVIIAGESSPSAEVVDVQPGMPIETLARTAGPNGTHPAPSAFQAHLATQFLDSLEILAK